MSLSPLADVALIAAVIVIPFAASRLARRKGRQEAPEPPAAPVLRLVPAPEPPGLDESLSHHPASLARARIEREAGDAEWERVQAVIEGPL
jgi:hypothetical protein